MCLRNTCHSRHVRLIYKTHRKNRIFSSISHPRWRNVKSFTKITISLMLRDSLRNPSNKPTNEKLFFCSSSYNIETKFRTQKKNYFQNLICSFISVSKYEKYKVASTLYVLSASVFLIQFQFRWYHLQSLISNWKYIYSAFL